MKKLKNLLLCAVILFTAQSIFAQKDCEKLFFKAMSEAQAHIQAKGLSQTDADAYVLKLNEKMKVSNPDCFPDEHEEVHADAVSQKRSKALQVDSDKLNDEEIQSFDEQYAKASATCTTELKTANKNLSSAQAKQTIHECAMDKIVAGN